MSKPKLAMSRRISGKTPHYLCRTCPNPVYREGGYATAVKHFKERHPDAQLDITVEARTPQVPRNRRTMVQ